MHAGKALRHNSSLAIQAVLITLFLSLSYAGSVCAQSLLTKNEVYTLETRKGNIFKGRLKEETETDILLITKKYGEVLLQKSEIVRLKHDGYNYEKPFENQQWETVDSKSPDTPQAGSADSTTRQMPDMPVEPYPIGQSITARTKSGQEFAGTVNYNTDSLLVLDTKKYGRVTIRKEDLLPDTNLGAGVDKSLTGRKVVVYLHDQQQFTGVVEGDTPDVLTLRTPRLGLQKLQKKEISKIDVLDAGRQIVLHNPELSLFSNRYLATIAPAGIKAGDVYFSNYLLTFNEFNVGVTDNFSLGAGFIPTFLFDGYIGLPYWVHAQAWLPLNDKLAATARLAVFGETELGTAVSVLGGGLMFGSADNHLLIELLFPTSSQTQLNAPVVHLGGIHKWRQDRLLVGEAVYVSEPNDEGLLLYFAMRFDNRSFSFDLGLFGLSNRYSTGAIPAVGITVPLHLRQRQ